MSMRFFHRVHLAPGLTLNLSRGFPSLSVGVRGAHLTASRAGLRRTVGLPGSGLFYTSRQGWHSGAHSSHAVHRSQGIGAVPLLVFGAGLIALVYYLVR